MSKTISARIDDTIHQMITEEANQTGITVNEKLKGMIDKHFNEEKNEEFSKKLDEVTTEEIFLIKESLEQKIRKGPFENVKSKRRQKKEAFDL